MRGSFPAHDRDGDGTRDEGRSWGHAQPRGVHKLGSPAHPGALGDRPPDALTPLAGVLLDLCWILLPAAVVRFRHASVVVVRALVMSGTTIMDKPLPALRALMGPIQVCRQTTGLDQRPECDHAAGDRCGTLGRRRPGFPSDFPPPNMGLRETGRNGRGRPVTAEAVDRPFVHVTSGLAGQVGMRRDWRGAGGATCKSPALPTQVRILSLPHYP